MQPISNTTATTTSTPYYPPYHQHQPPYRNPNYTQNTSVIDPYAPPSPPYPATSPLDYQNYPSSYPQFPDHTLASSPSAPSFPNSNLNPQFNFDHASSAPYFPHDYDPNPVPSYAPPHYSAPTSFGSYDDGAVKLDRWGGYDEQGYGGGGAGGSGDDGVYRYEGGKVEPYGARETSGYSNSSSQVMFDDYGRPISLGNGIGNGNGSGYGGGKAGKVVKAVPKEDAEEEDLRGGVQKFRVKVLAEGYAQTDMDVLCQKITGVTTMGRTFPAA